MSLSILYLRCINWWGCTPHVCTSRQTFNSLFEMPVFIRQGDTARHKDFQFSIWDAWSPASTRPAVEKTAPFNSLFEMLPLIPEKARSMLNEIPFNSLFEMPPTSSPALWFTAQSTFNSLFEMRLCAERAERAFRWLCFQFSIWDAMVTPPWAATCWRPSFQFSIWDADAFGVGLQRAEDAPFQFSTWDAGCYSRQLPSQLLYFQFSIWDAVSVSPT